MEFLSDEDGKPIKDDYTLICPKCWTAYTSGGIGPPTKRGDMCLVCGTPTEEIEEG